MEEYTHHIITCKTTGIYPRNALQFSILSGNTEVVSMTDASDTEEINGTFTEELVVSVYFTRSYTQDKLKCKATYVGPGGDGIHDVSKTSGALDVFVRCECFIQDRVYVLYKYANYMIKVNKLIQNYFAGK